MAQRGGGVQAHLRLSDSAISSNLIGRGRADMILGMEPLECLRQVDYLGPTGVLIISAEPYRNIPDYPEDEELKQLLAQVGNSHLVPTEKLARQAGSVRTANMVLIGVASPFLPVNTDSIEKAVRLIFASKGEEAIENNLRAMRLGMQR
jgi:indolepyruvate ferredoxin oxidoreductase beta subunit